MICAIHQPQYLPWLGYLSKIDAADLFVLYDDTDYKHDEWQNRNRIRSGDGGWRWLTVPVHHRQGEPIRDIRIDNTRPWARKHAHAIATHYGRTPFYPAYGPELIDLYSKPWERLADLNIAVVRLLCRWFGIGTRLVLSSELNYTGRSTRALISICREAGADAYLSGPGGRDYLETERFEAAGLELQFHDYSHPVYPQRGNNEFTPGLAAIDLLFHCGPESPALLRSGRHITVCPATQPFREKA